MTRLLTAAAVALALTPAASAGTFAVGIADPGSGAISGADVSALGISIERRSVVWDGSSTFDGELTWTPGVREFVSVFGGYPSAHTPTTPDGRSRYCSFVGSILDRYPDVADVAVWNEPNLSSFWGAGAAAYARLLDACAPVIRAHGALVVSGMAPADAAGAFAWASELTPGSIDVWDQHLYGEIQAAELPSTIAAVRAALGRSVPVLVGESGGLNVGQVSAMLTASYCAGASGWLNFNLRDDGDWYPTGLRNFDGSRKDTYGAVESIHRAIDSGSISCAPPPAPPPPPPPTPPGAVGKPNCIVPALGHRRVVAAKRRLVASHCRIGRVRFARSRRVAKGHVVRQALRPGTTLGGGALVALVVSRGR